MINCPTDRIDLVSFWFSAIDLVPTGKLYWTVTLSMNSFLTQHQPPSAPQPSSTFRLDWLCWTALALTLILRVGWMVLKPESLAIDRDAYLLLAQNLVHGEGFCGPGGVPTAFRPPLFPLLLAPLL